MHAPETQCIAKGKLRKPYEFGHKVGFIPDQINWQPNPTVGNIKTIVLTQIGFAGKCSLLL